jgi:hypothetical protein
MSLRFTCLFALFVLTCLSSHGCVSNGARGISDFELGVLHGLNGRVLEWKNRQSGESLRTRISFLMDRESVPEADRWAAGDLSKLPTQTTMFGYGLGTNVDVASFLYMLFEDEVEKGRFEVSPEFNEEDWMQFRRDWKLVEWEWRH